MTTEKCRINFALDHASRRALDLLRRRHGFNLSRMIEQRLLQPSSLAERLLLAATGTAEWRGPGRVPSASVYLSDDALAVLETIPKRLRSAWVRATILTHLAELSAPIESAVGGTAAASAAVPSSSSPSTPTPQNDSYPRRRLLR